jgi:hypothetical protein
LSVAANVLVRSTYERFNPRDQERGIQIRRMEIFRCGEIVESCGGAKSDKDGEATFTTSPLTAATNNWLALPVALN